MSKLEMSKNLILMGALLSFLFSVYLWFTGAKQEGLYVGLWVPSILAFGALLFAGRAS